MAVRCIQVSSCEEFVKLLQPKENDFWVSSIAETSVRDLPEKMLTYRVEDALVHENFSTCYYKGSKDIKGDANVLMDMVGLGLRRMKNVRSRNVPGCIFVLVQDNGPSGIQQQRTSMTTSDKKLPVDERLRRSECLMEVVPSLEKLIARVKAMRQLQNNFYLTSNQATNAEDAKRKTVSYMIDGEAASTKFSACLIAEVPDCQMATLSFANQFGLGMRRISVRSRSSPGALVLFYKLPPALKTGKQIVAAAGAGSSSGRGSAAAIEDAAAKRRRTEPPAPAPAAAAPLLPLCDQSASRAVAPSEAAKAQGPQGPAAMEEAEELYFRQICVLERRLGELLQQLPREQLSTTFVQNKLEEYMQKPPGRFVKFRKDIARIWRAYAESTAAQESNVVPDVD